MASAREWTSASTAGDGSVFTFRGSRIGESIDHKVNDFRSQYRDGPYGGCEQDKDVPSLKTCDDKSFGDLGAKKLGDIPLLITQYQYLDERLIGIWLSFHSRNFFEMRDILTGKYGPANDERIETINNRAGASFENIVSVWNTPHGPMQLEQRFGRIDSSSLRIVERDAESEIEQRRKTVRGAAGKSLL
jgi:hypothetical protein